MNCPECGAYSEVLETRTRNNGSVTRRRKCANEHKFTTVETNKIAPNSLAHAIDRLVEIGFTDAAIGRIFNNPMIAWKHAKKAEQADETHGKANTGNEPDQKSDQPQRRAGTDGADQA